MMLRVAANQKGQRVHRNRSVVGGSAAGPGCRVELSEQIERGTAHVLELRNDIPERDIEEIGVLRPNVLIEAGQSVAVIA